MRVVIVDDDVWVRAGRQAVLEQADGVELVAATDHTAARRWPWHDIDVLVLDAHDPDAGFDRFAGVAVAAAARRASSSTRIVVLSGHTHNDLLRVRMAEAGADEFYPHRQIASPEALVALVHRPRSRPVDVATSRERAGISPDARVNDAVEWAAENLGTEAFDATTQASSGTSRRRFITARRRLSSMIGIEARPSSAARRTLPPWRDLARLVDRARGHERRG